MSDRIADELMRGDLTSQIANTINDAISIYQKERFRFNETNSTTFLTQVGQQDYNASNTIFSDPKYPTLTNLSPQSFYSIEKLLITVPPAVFVMDRIQPSDMLVLTQTGTQIGQPYNWSYDNETISLYPVPSSGGPGQINSFGFTNGAGYTTGVYTNNPLTGGSGSGATANITVSAGTVTAVQVVNPGTNYILGDVLSSVSIGPGVGFTLTVTSTFTGATGPYLMTILGHIQLPGPTDPADVTCRWMLDAERLIRSRAKYELAVHVTRNAMMAQMMSPEEPANGALPGATYAAYRELKVEAMRMQQRGILRPMYFSLLGFFACDTLFHLMERAISWPIVS